MRRLGANIQDRSISDSGVDIGSLAKLPLHQPFLGATQKIRYLDIKNYTSVRRCSNSVKILYIRQGKK